jgi:hypothetical protein
MDAERLLLDDNSIEKSYSNEIINNKYYRIYEEAL